MSAALEELKRIAGPGGFVEDAARLEPYLRETRGRFRGEARLVLRPDSPGQLSQLVAACHAAGIAMVPQGGNTGLCGGAVASADEVVISTDRLTRIRDLDAADNTITVEAGVILADIQAAAEAAARLFPLSLGAEGSCRIGGNLSTNAGGVGVLRYGNSRDLVLGLEVVLADGTVWNGLRRLRKDNTGYDLKQLFIGAEGTLGIITAAVLKLFPRPRQAETCLCGLPSPAAALALLASARDVAGETVSAIELMPATSLALAEQHVPGTRVPLASPHPWYVLLELTSAGTRTPLRPAIEEILELAHERGVVDDAVIAESEAQRSQLWFLREAIVEAQRHAGASIKHDVAVPVSRVPELIERGTAAAQEIVPGCRPMPFGHVGDGNMHFNITQPPGADGAGFLAHYDAMNRRIHDIVVALEGTISAEHGIGTIKRAELAERRPGIELEIMRGIKDLLDPAGLMNPGKVVPER